MQLFIQTNDKIINHLAKLIEDLHVLKYQLTKDIQEFQSKIKGDALVLETTTSTAVMTDDKLISEIVSLEI